MKVYQAELNKRKYTYYPLKKGQCSQLPNTKNSNVNNTSFPLRLLSTWKVESRKKKFRRQCGANQRKECHVFQLPRAIVAFCTITAKHSDTSIWERLHSGSAITVTPATINYFGNLLCMDTPKLVMYLYSFTIQYQYLSI